MDHMVVPLNLARPIMREALFGPAGAPSTLRDIVVAAYD